MTLGRRFVADRRRAFLWWSLGVLVTVGLTVVVWPSVRGQQQFEDLMRDLPPAVRALFGAQEGIPFTSPAGYLHGRLFSGLLPSWCWCSGSASEPGRWVVTRRTAPSSWCWPTRSAGPGSRSSATSPWRC